MREEIDLIANVQKGAARKRPDGKLSSLAGGLLPVDKFHFLLDDLNGSVQLVALVAKFFRLLREHFKIVPQRVVMEKIPYLGKRVSKASQISYGGERIDLVKVIKPAAVFAVAYLRDKKPFCVIVA